MSNIERYDYAFDIDGDSWPARLLRNVPPACSVLELGPGAGVMTKVLLGRGCQVTVVENDPEALKILQSMGVHVMDANLDHPDWVQQLGGRRFDAILACDVLEHLQQPERVLQTLKDVVEPTGRLVVSLPNVAYAGVIASLCSGLFDYTDKGLLDRTHLRFFTRRSIEKTMLDCGWRPHAWDANRVPLSHSEFAWIWDALPGALRQPLIAASPDFDVYQWMVVVAPAVDARHWEIVNMRSDLDRMQTQLQSLQLLHDAEHTSLLEHQKAFGEARQIIAKFEKKISELEHGVTQLSAEKQALESDLNLAQQHLNRMRRSWKARLKSILGM